MTIVPPPSRRLAHPRLSRWLRLRRLNRADVARALEVSLPTASRYLHDPLLLDGYQRRTLAALLGTSEELLFQDLAVQFQPRGVDNL